MEFKEAMMHRRSRYELTSTSPLNPDQLKALLVHALNHTPSAYNAQGGRLLLALNEHHQAIWDALIALLKTRQSEERFAKSKAKIEQFKKAYGTVLFFNDLNVIKEYQKKYPKYAEQTELWSQQSHGMLQYVVWTSFADAKIGASLQHYNPLIDDAIKSLFAVPDSWKLTAQMPFGIAKGSPKEKHFKPIETRLKVFE